MNMKFLAVVTPPSIYHYISKPEAQSRAGGYFSSEKSNTLIQATPPEN